MNSTLTIPTLMALLTPLNKQEAGGAATGAEVAFHGEAELADGFFLVGEAGEFAGGADADVLGQGLGDAVSEAHDPVFAEALLPARADTPELGDDVLDPFLGGQGAGRAQDQADQAAQALSVGGHVAAGFADVDEQFKRLLVAATVGVDGDIGRADGRIFAVGVAV